MKTGITLPQYGSQATKENIIHLAKAPEQEQLDSLWVLERLLWLFFQARLMGIFHLLYKTCLIQWKHLLLLQQKQTKLH
jgi:hypothetical protein